MSVWIWVVLGLYAAAAVIVAAAFIDKEYYSRPGKLREFGWEIFLGVLCGIFWLPIALAKTATREG